MCFIPIFVDDVLDREIDEYFDRHIVVKKSKMIKEQDVIKIIKDCVDRPKGIVPDSVYELIPDIKF